MVPRECLVTRNIHIMQYELKPYLFWFESYGQG